MFILHAFILASDVIDQMAVLEPSVHMRYVMYTDDEIHDERSILGAVLFTNRIYFIGVGNLVSLCDTLTCLSISSSLCIVGLRCISNTEFTSNVLRNAD